MFILLLLMNNISYSQTWNTNGNLGSFSNFIGTTNNYPFLFRTNNVERMRIQPNGFVGIGVANPLQRLDVFGNVRVRGNIYVDQNVYQQGQFDADTVDAGVLNAGDISAAKVSADSIRGHVYTMDENSKFVGESKFQNAVKIQENLLIGENVNNEILEKFEVRGGNAKFEGDVKLNHRLVFGDNQHGFTFIPATETNTTNYLRFGEDPIGVPNFNYCNYPKFNVELDVQGEFKVFKETPEGDIHTLSMFCDGANSIIESAGTNGNEVGGPSLLLNYYCGKDIHAVTGVTGGKLVVGKPQNTQLAFNVRGNSVLEGKLNVWGTTLLNGNVGIGIGNPTEKLHVVGKTILNGNVLIGNNSTPNSKLVIEGIAYAREFHVNLNNNWPDFVFEEDYRLTPLNEVESYIKKNKHLLGVPAESELKKEGINTSEMLAIQMKKIEELTLYLIELKKENEEIKKTLSELNH